MENVKMKDIPSNDRPYEKCVRLGPDALSDEELLSIIIRSGSREANSLETAKKVLALNYPHDGILGLCRLTLPELKTVSGIGTVKGIQLMCIGELSKRISKRFAVNAIRKFAHPELVANYYMEEVRHLESEHLYAMFLDNKNGLIKEMLISKGTVNACIASPREVFIEAVRYHAVGIVLVHNHPSGDPTPSEADRLMTMRMKHAGELLGIQLLDHVVIGEGSYSSFKKEGII